MIRIVIGWVLLVVLVGCSGGGANPQSAANAIDNQSPGTGQTIAPQIASTPEPSLPLNGAGEQIIARVNGEDITLSQFERSFTRNHPQADAASYDAIASQELDTLIEQRIITQAAAELEISISPAELEAEYAGVRERAQNETAWQNWLTENLFTDAELRQFLNDTLLTQRLIEEVTDIEGDRVAEVNARHIVVDTEAEAAVIVARLAEGEDFAALAAAYSKDITTRDAGGDLGWFTADGLLVPELAQLAFQLQPNEMAGPFETLLGYHIIQTLGFDEREVIPEDQAAQAAQQFANWLNTQRQNAQIERFVDY